MPHKRIYSINLKASKDFNANLTYFIYLKSTFNINIDVHSMRITQEGLKHVGVIQYFNCKTLYHSIVHLFGILLEF